LIFDQDNTEISDAGSMKWENSIAVLPFDDLSPEKDQDYFCDGMTEQIITNLSKINRFKVIGRTSVMKFKNTKKTLPEIGNELNVTHILEGSIRKYGNSIRVTAQLINTENGFHIWAEDFDKELTHVFEVQDDVSLAIAKALSKRLSLKEIGEIKTIRPANTEAYEYYLKANHFSKKYDLFQNFEDLFTAEDLYKRAIELDPTYLSSYTGISYLYSEIILRRPEEKEKYLPLKEQYLKIAEKLDPNSAEVLYDKSYLYQVKGQPEKRYEYLRKALRLNPNHFGANQQMGIFLRQKGVSYHAFPYFNRAIEVNPLGQWAYATRGWAYFDIGDFDKAEKDFKTNLEIEPNDYWTLFRYSALLIMLKREKDAQELLNHFENEYSENAYPKYYKSLLLITQGDSVKALSIFKETGIDGWGEVIFNSVLNRKDEAISLMIEHLQHTEYTRDRQSRYLQLSHLLWYNNLRSDPRFQEILAKHKKLYEENLAKYGDIDI
jgi:TolB-like protein